MSIVAFIGLGLMGAPMARHVVARSSALRVFDVNEAACAGFTDLAHCEVAGSPAEAARGADVLITMLPESTHVESVLFGPEGAVKTLKKNALVIEMSTGSPTATIAFGARLAAEGLRMIDAPVGRTPAHAKSGDLLVLVGGATADIDEAIPILSCFGTDIVRVGAFGDAIRMKLVNNYMTMVSLVLTAETLMFARKAGLDRDKAVRVLQSTVAGIGQINTNFPNKVLAGDLSPDFPLRLGLKDLSLALELAREVGAPLALGGASRELFVLAEPWGMSEQDCTAMLPLLESLARCRPESARASGESSGKDDAPDSPP